MNTSREAIVITSAVRTAIGTFKGSLKNVKSHELGSVAIKNDEHTQGILCFLKYGVSSGSQFRTFHKRNILFLSNA